MPVTLDITSDISGVVAALRASRVEALAAQAVAVGAFGRAYRDELVLQTPRGKGEAREGRRLFESYETDEGASGTTATYRITNRAPQLRYVLQGRGPVAAKRAKALRFVISGVVYFRRRVRAAPANNFPARVRQTMDAQRGRLVETVARGVVGAMRGGVR